MQAAHHLSTVMRMDKQAKEWAHANAAFLKAIENEPHPLRTQKIHAKRWNTAAKILPPRTGNPGEFLAFRRHAIASGFPMIAVSDLLFLLEDDPRIFHIEPDIGELLLNTELRGAYSEMLNLPFRTIYLNLPPSNIRVWAGADDVGMLEGVYLTEEHGESRKLLSLLAVGKKDTNVLDDCLFTAPFFFTPDAPIDEQVKQHIAEVESRKTAVEELNNLAETLRTFTWAINCVLYINSAGADTQEEWWHRSAAEKMRKVKGTKRTKIRNMLEATSARIIRVGTRTKIGGGWSSEDRAKPGLHWVRGSWRRQAHGKGRSLRKHIWVKPYPRGEGREIVTSMYKVVKGRKDDDRVLLSEETEVSESPDSSGGGHG